MKPRVVLAAVTLVAAALVVDAPNGAGAPGDVSAPEWVSTGRDGPSTAPAVSADGSQVAFRTRAPQTQLSSSVSPGDSGDTVAVRNRTAGTTTVLATPGKATRPSVSGNGRLVAWTRDEQDDPSGGNGVYVADRDPERDGTLDQGPPLIHPITGMTDDVPYQRPCTLPFDDDNNRTCSPVLSSDGSTVMFPARQDQHSPHLTLKASLDDGAPQPLPGDLIDFGLAASGGYLTIYLGSDDPQPVTIGNVSIVGGDGTIRIDQSDCAGTNVADSACSASLRFSVPEQGCTDLVTYRATLLVTGSDPRARAAYPIVADCRLGLAFASAHRPAPGTATATLAAETTATTPAATPPVCPAPDYTGVLTDGVTPTSGAPRYTVVDGGPVPIGQARLVAFALPSSSTFTPPPDCAVQAVTPPPALQQPDAAPPCAGGAGDTPCTAYLYLRPNQVGTAVGTWNTAPYCDDECISTRVTVRGVRDVVVARRDASGNGDFAGSGRPAPVVVSTDGAGNQVDGQEPSVSDTGRYVAFSTATGPGRSRVVVHDTDAAGDGTYRPGATQATTVPDPQSGSPSLSGDGARVAFTAGDTVYLADSGGTGTAQATNAAAPALSADASTLAYIASPDGESPPAVYVTALPASGASPTRLAPRGEAPAVDANGSTIAFQTGEALDPADQNDFTDVYAVHREPATTPPSGPPPPGPPPPGQPPGQPPPRSGVTLSPAGLGFGGQALGTASGPRTVTIRNTGAVPLAVGQVGTAGQFRTLGPACRGARLAPGGSCAVAVVFAPGQPGAARGALLVTAAFSGGALATVRATLTGSGIAPRAELTPRLLDFGRLPANQTTAPMTARLTNNGPGPFPVRSIRTTGPFRLTGNGCLPTLARGVSCTVQVSFTPTRPGAAVGALVVDGGAGPPLRSTLTGSGIMLTLETLVGPPGSAAVANGAGFPPSNDVTLSWDPGLGSALIRADGAGNFTASVPIPVKDLLGPRTVLARYPGGSVTGQRFLVVPTSGQPPGFYFRG